MSVSKSNSLKPLIPKGNDTLEKESFESYKGRVSSSASNIPDCVLENWIYRHYLCVVSDYSFLNFNKMQFIKEHRSKEDIYLLIKSYDDSWINNLGYQLYKRNNKSWLQDYMLKNMTWPVPIIVLENKEASYLNDRGMKMGVPFHLLEGHLRLNYFREIYRTENEMLKDTHLIWKVNM
ncbi:hypothetical protein ACFYKT_18395 [Cytobacillus sp. FJAT-53684]|uniref:Uncharacterized protein n=1 Tax=Cytobacillus mangrovibacter TaxID=3299024 RepID=A0ABW6K6E5_9BACI